ncbi:DUF3237 family protein [Cellulomonas palmilytica]|uniref:DUF3237 family protein n=1 Tax=Cellulomonas palmilytica TaxID=2608402 RepID=UPI001F1BE696|nr:DUF3237 family protein [Cellulomonas palmilytica]UJP40638.1 DUF3237 family protein [Cellulomonas palmilytica]
MTVLPGAPALTGEHVLTIDALLGEVVEVGHVPTGFRRVIPIVGGTVSGDVDGEVLPGGADWNLARPDGTVELWARYELRLAGGVVVSVLNTAVHPPSPTLPILTAPRFEVPAHGPAWLATGVHVGLLVPRLDEHRVSIEVLRVGLVG